MKQKIKFRGKRIDNSEWIYGDLIENQGRYFIYHATSETTIEDNEQGGIVIRATEVLFDSVCQYVFETIGDNDETIEIYDNDVVEGNDLFEEGFTGIVVWDEDNHSFIINLPEEEIAVDIDESICILRVVGNVIDNPEYIKQDNDESPS